MRAAASSRTSALVSEDVAEFDYRPTACHKTYRMIVVRKNLTVEKGERAAVRRLSLLLLPHQRLDELGRPRSCSRPTTAATRRTCTPNSKAACVRCTAPVDNLESNWAYMVMTALAWNLKAWWALWLTEAPGRWQRASSAGESRRCWRMEFKTFVNAFVRLPCQIVRTGRRLIYRLLGWNPWQRSSSARSRSCAAERGNSKPESGCSGPPRRSLGPAGRKEGDDKQFKDGLPHPATGWRSLRRAACCEIHPAT